MSLTIPEELQTFYNKQMRFSKAGYMVVKVNDDGKGLTLLSTGEKGADWAEACEKELPDDHCRMMFFDFNFTYENRHICKTVLVNWIPSGCKIFEKVRYSSQK